METNNNTDNTIKLADRFLIAMFSPKEYGRILKEKQSKLVQFLFVLILLITMVRYLIPTLAMVAGMGGFEKILTKEIPTFSIENGELSIDKRVEQKDEINGVYLLVDTDEKKFSEKDIPDDVIEAVMVSGSNMLVYNKYMATGQKCSEIKFSDWKDFVLNNQVLVNHVGYFYLGIGIMVITMYFVEFAKYLLIGLGYALFMLLYSNLLMRPVSFGKAYKTSMFAQAIGTIVYSITCGIGNAVFIVSGNVFQFMVALFILQRVLLPIKRLD